MQTRRDQLQAYRFQNRRALAALVKGEPNVLEPPMRRLTVTTLSGIMIAILIAAGFAALGLIHRSAGTSWKNSQSVIVDNDTASTYVYLHGTLHPVLNFTSAVLAVAGSGSGQVPRVTVSSSDIAKARYGAEIGIQQIPSALPPAGSLLGFPMSVCSVQHRQGTSGHVRARVTLAVSANPGGAHVSSSQGVVVVPASGTSQTYLLLQGKRLPISGAGLTALNLNSQPPLVVGTAFINSVPLGPTLAAPHIPRQGRPADFSIGSHQLSVGSIATTGTHGASYLVLSNGFAPLTAFERALFVGNPSETVTQEQVVAHQLTQATVVSNAFVGLPPNPPSLDAASATRAGVCAVYGRGESTPRFELSRSARPSFAGNVGESKTSSTGYADKVLIPATKGVLATPANNPRTTVFISDQGRQYAFGSSGLIAAFGYSHADITNVPAALLKLIPPGPGLQTGAARERVAFR